MSLTMGVEEEFSLYLNGEPVQVDLKDFRPSDGVSLAIENHVSILEIITPVHNSLPSLVENVTTNRLWLQKEAERLAFSFEACGVPTQFYWGKCGLRTTDDKYKKLLARYGACSSDIMTMGMHIHFGGIPEDHIPAVFNGTRRFIPFLIAMSANSKSTHHTGVNIASSRLFKSAIKPRTGIPNSMSNVNDYRTQLQRMLITQTVDSLTEQWHDIRFHPVHQTLEIR
jgi:carboxylate-amine ligase